MNVSSRRGVPGRLFLAVGAIGILATSCAQNAPQDTLDPAGPFARQADDLWDITFLLAAIVFFLVEGALVFAVIRFRRRSADDMPIQNSHNTRVEIAWTLIPALILAGLAVPTVAGIFDLAKRPAGEVLDVSVTGHQWWWEYQYPDLGVITANELVIPTGVPVVLALESKDVIHSFWVPRLGGKQDVVPGRINHMKIQADEPGEFLGQCAEFCGLSHANMRLKVIVKTASEFEQWVSDQRKDSTEKLGLARSGLDEFLEVREGGLSCAGCHTVAGTDAGGVLGPNLTHFASRTSFAGAMFANDTDNLRAWVRDAPSLKPGSKMPSGMRDLGLTDGEIEALVAFLESLE